MPKNVGKIINRNVVARPRCQDAKSTRMSTRMPSQPGCQNVSLETRGTVGTEHDASYDATWSGCAIIAPARSAGASYSETGVSNDQVSIRCPFVRKKRAKHQMVSAPARKTDTIRVIFQSLFKVPKKTAFCEADLKIDLKLTPAVPERSCPRT